MDGALLPAILGTTGVFVIQVVAFAYGYGKLTAKVDNLRERMGRIETAFNHRATEHRSVGPEEAD